MPKQPRARFPGLLYHPDGPRPAVSGHPREQLPPLLPRCAAGLAAGLPERPAAPAQQRWAQTNHMCRRGKHSTRCTGCSKGGVDAANPTCRRWHYCLCTAVLASAHGAPLTRPSRPPGLRRVVQVLPDCRWGAPRQQLRFRCWLRTAAAVAAKCGRRHREHQAARPLRWLAAPVAHEGCTGTQQQKTQRQGCTSTSLCGRRWVG